MSMNIIILLYLIFPYVHEVPMHFFLPTLWSSKNSTLIWNVSHPLKSFSGFTCNMDSGLYNLMLPILYIYCHHSDPVPQPSSQPLAAVHTGLSMWPFPPLDLLAFLFTTWPSPFILQVSAKEHILRETLPDLPYCYRKPLCHHLPLLHEVTQSCPTLCDPIDCSPPGSSIHGIF